MWVKLAVLLVFGGCGKTVRDAAPEHSGDQGGGVGTGSESSGTGADIGNGPGAATGAGGSGAGTNGMAGANGTAGENGTAGSAGERAFDPCDGLSAYDASGPGEAGGSGWNEVLGYTLYFRPRDGGCEALVAPYFFEPEIYDVRIETDSVTLTPREYAAYEERSAAAGRSASALQSVTLKRDAQGEPSEAHLVTFFGIDRVDGDWWSEHTENTLPVRPLENTLHLAAPTLDARGLLPWEGVRVSFYPPIENQQALPSLDASAYSPWAPTELQTWGAQSWPNVIAPRPSQVLEHSSVMASVVKWTPDMGKQVISVSGLIDMAGRALSSATLELPVETLPAPRSLHEFDGEQTFKVFPEGQTVYEPAACTATGCLAIRQTLNTSAGAAGVVDTSGADSLRLRFVGEALVSIVSPDATTVQSHRLGSCFDSTTATELTIPTEGAAYLGVFLATSLDTFCSERLYVDTIWAE